MREALGVLVVLALMLLGVAWRRRDGSLSRGIIAGWQTLRRTLPLLLLAFLIVGYVDVLAPQQWVQAWLGPHSGWRGILVAEGVGMVLPGGPYVVFPLVALLYRAGAGLGPVVTMVTSWAMLGLISVSFEVSFMGWRFTAVRWGLGVLFPVLVGGMVMVIAGG